MTEPLYASPQSVAQILARLNAAYAAIQPGQDMTKGSIAHAALAPVAEELAAASMLADITLSRAFVATAPLQYLVRHGEQYGIYQKPSTKSSGLLNVEGVAGTVVSVGTRFTTASVGSVAGQSFVTNYPLTLDSNGLGAVEISAVEPGSAGNVPAFTIALIANFNPGVTRVYNDLAMTGGADIEATEVYRARLLFRLQHPASSGNIADHIAWAMAEPGVGNVGVMPVEFGPGTVGVCLTGIDGLPASQRVIDETQLAIAPPWVREEEAEAMIVEVSNGVSQIERNDASGLLAVQMVYDDAAPGVGGRLRQNSLDTLLPKAGMWELHVLLVVTNSYSTMPVVSFGVYNDTELDYAATTPTGPLGASLKTLTAAEAGGVSFIAEKVDFYWNGVDHIHPRIDKINLYDNNAVVLVDSILYRSKFSKDDGSGKAPIGQSVSYRAAEPVYIDVAARIAPMRGFDPITARLSAAAAIAAYVVEQALSLTDKTIRYGEIARRIFLASGVNDYTALTVNNSVFTVPIGPCEVPVLGSIVFETWDEFDAQNRYWDQYDALRRIWTHFPGDT